MRDLYRKIWSVTGRMQAPLVVLSIAVALLVAVHLQYQKDIINGLAYDKEVRQLLFMGAEYLGVIVLTALLIFALGYRSSLLGETVIRELRTRISRKGLQDVGAGRDNADERAKLVPMIVAEAEEVGRFAGTAVSTPLVQVGTVLSIIAFIASTQPLLGLFVMCVVLPQTFIVWRVQKHINSRVVERTQLLRGLSDRLRLEDARDAERAVLEDFDSIYEARRKVFVFKLSSKLALYIINGLGTVGILMFGGWMVIEGRTEIGTVVADLAGLARMTQPWRELLAFYRSLSAVRVKYELLRSALPG